MSAQLPLIAGVSGAEDLLWSGGRAVSAAQFLRQVRLLARRLPAGRHAVNLCEHRDNFLLAWCAVVSRGQINLLPASRAPQVVEEVCGAYAGSYCLDDERVLGALAQTGGAPAGGAGAAGGPAAGTVDPGGPQAGGRAADAAMPLIAADQVVQIAFTSGSTGAPRAHAKRWGSLHHSTAHNAARIRECLVRHGQARPWVVATVPPQHMWGAETTVMMPLMEGMAVHAGRPLFPADVAQALAEVPEPRVLVTTPVHLRTLVASAQAFPPVGAVVSATAPLPVGLAGEVERVFGAPMLELFGSTETCVIASRLTAHEQAWRLYPGVRVEPRADHTLVDAPWFDRPTPLQDLVEPAGQDRLFIRGRNADMIEVAGKRASLAELTRRLLELPGVRDAVVFQPEEVSAAGAAGVHRVAALVVAPGLSAQGIAAQLARAVDPVFLPRPLLLVDALPRNDTGKLDRTGLLRLLGLLRAGGGG